MKKLETSILGGLLAAIGGTVAATNTEWPAWGVIGAAALAGLVAGYAYAVLRP